LLELNHGLIKNASGYDLRHLFIGSEGTLGFITEASLRLDILPLETKVIFFAVPNNSHFIDILNIFMEELQITAFEFFSNSALKCMIDESKLPAPFANFSPFYVLLEYEAEENDKKLVVDLINKCLKMKLISDALLSENIQQANYFWRYRKEISSSLQKYFPYKYDLAVLPSKIPAFINHMNDIFNNIYPNFKIIWFGHVADGNLHLNILKPENLSGDEFFSYCNKMSAYLYSTIREYQGTISAEHGIGILKKEFLHYTKTNAEINYMKLIKKIFDPNNIINPGKIF
jgi:FAD/FMN-containing dehydrogenase